MNLLLIFLFGFVCNTIADPIDVYTLNNNLNSNPLIDSDFVNVDIEPASLNPDILEDSLATTPRLAEKYGYASEIHTVTTDDGYILEMHRIPGGPKSPPGKNKPVAFLMHGILASSGDWVLMGPNQGFAYILADLGYDIWMGNARGNRYSRKHVRHNPERKAFWQFSWHEIGVSDLPAMIDYVLKNTGQPNLHYIAHSQGTTAFWVMASERPEYNSKIRSMQALAPIAFMSNLRSPFIRAMVVFLNSLDWATSLLGIYEFMPNSDLMTLGGQAACRDEVLTQAICSNVLFLIAGFNSPQLNDTMIPVMLGHTPAGASTNQAVHYGQLVRSGYFRQYDFGYVSNLWRYGSIWPPNYDLSKISAPVALHYSDNDWLAEPTDVESLHRGLPNVLGKFRVRDPKFNHLDFLWAIDVKNLLYNRVINIMQLVENSENDTNYL